jgi:serine/threonine protein kinase
MTSTNALIPGLSSEEASALEALLANFQRLWHGDLLAEAHHQLSSAPDGLRRFALIEMVKIDLDRQWQRGQRQTLESYLRTYPDIGDSGTVPVRLIEAELKARAAAGEAVDLAAVQNRFPQRVGELGTLFARDETRNDLAANNATPSPSAGSISPPRASATDLPEQFGRYRIQRRLGKGGMGTVYLAQDTELHRLVAIKVPSAEACNDPETVERFFREARAAAALRHPNICPVYDVGRFQDTLYLTMAYIEGRTLHDVLLAGDMVSPAEAAVLMKKLALALEVAHRQGLLHRDLKPSNIMIDSAGEPVVMDFGLVRSTDQADANLTRSGVILGTPAYMAPEQALSDLGKIGPATDLYSTGVILYQLLAGRLPFTGNIHGLLLQTIHDDPPPPSRFRPGLDTQLEAICLKALAKKPDARFTTMADLALALDSCSTTSILSATTIHGGQPLSTSTIALESATIAARGPARTRRYSRWPLAAAMLLVAGMVLGIVMLSRQRSVAPASETWPIDQNTDSKVESERGISRSVDLAGNKQSRPRADSSVSDLLDVSAEPTSKPRESSQRRHESGKAVEGSTSSVHGRD